MFEKFLHNKKNEPIEYKFTGNGNLYVPSYELFMVGILEEERSEWERQLQIPPAPGNTDSVESTNSEKN